MKNVVKSKISWTGPTWNPWHGCTKVSAGCKFCYMFRDKERYGQEPTKVLKSKTQFKQPLKWKDGQLIFTCSWSDWFIEDADEWRDEAWEVIKNTPHHTYQILTKRPERILEHLPDDWGDGYPNVWLGVTVENNKERHRIKTLAEVPARIRFISAEPLIEDLNMGGYMDVLKDKFNWMILGGESGNETGKHRYRPSEFEWYIKLVDISTETDMKVFMKHTGTHLARSLGLKHRHGEDITEIPSELQIQEFPEDVSRYNLEK